ncbi:MAG: 16S rRNA (cytosine(1402)-N(4))-methyltransferase RsmH [Gemmatimonadaceae bacterium]
MTLPPNTAGEWDTGYHAPVLVGPVVDFLGGRPLVLDCTLGGGGHSAALLASGAGVIAVDRDPAALDASRSRLHDAALAGRFVAHQANYAHLERIDALTGVRFDGILLDLGISSHQIDATARGFSFREGAVLDMRMGADAPHDAADLLNSLSEAELARVFRDYGDERRAGRLAREVVRRREHRPFVIADDLVGAIRAVLGSQSGPAEFARLFQAVRIAVNDELAGLAAALPALRDRLRPGGILAVISYHSGEDRIVKHAFREWSSACTCPPRQPMCTCRGHALGETLTRRPLTADATEVAHNPRARSAHLRLWRSAE